MPPLLCDHDLSETYEVAKKFPLIPAKLLMMGLPFELMNGDISHVPIVWVKAVLMELEHKIFCIFRMSKNCISVTGLHI
jgi:hypothetical protein